MTPTPFPHPPSSRQHAGNSQTNGHRAQSEGAQPPQGRTGHGRTTMHQLPHHNPQRPNPLPTLHTQSRPTTTTQRQPILHQRPQTIPPSSPRTRPNLRQLHARTSHNRRPLPNRTPRPHTPSTQPQRPPIRTRPLQKMPRPTHSKHHTRRMERTPLTSNNTNTQPKPASP